MLTHPDLRLLSPFVLLAAACGTSSPSTGGADASPDAPLFSDGALSDTGSPSQDAGTLVAQCQALATNFKFKCAGSNPRPCLWDAYDQLCAKGQTKLLIDAMNCLDSTTCRTFSDPNEGEACLTQVLASEESPAAKSFLQDLCTTCGGSACQPIAGFEIYPYLTDADLAAIEACPGGYASFCIEIDASAVNASASAVSCLAANGDLAPFMQCP